MGTSNWNNYWRKEQKLQYWQKPEKSVIEFAKNFRGIQMSKVLDLGCGIGRHAIFLAKEGFEVTAFDGSKQALETLEITARNMNLDIKIVEGNYLYPQFKPCSFDIVISYNVIYHGNRESFNKAIELCHKYLKTEGILFFTCPTREDDKYGNGRKVAPHTYESMNSVHPGDIHYFADEDDLKDLLKGFELISIQKKEHYWDNNGKEQFSSYWEVTAKK